MGHLLSTVNPQAAEDADSGWKPAGPPLRDDAPKSFAEAIDRGLTEVVRDSIKEEVLENSRPSSSPSIGHIVVYHLRNGDSRNRRIKFPAIVMDSDPETGTLKLWVIVDDGDTWMQDHVPAREAPEPGWELVNEPPAIYVNSPIAISLMRLGDRVEALENHPAVSVPPLPTISRDGDFRPGGITWAKQDETLADLIRRIEVLEAKRGPGRPAKPKDE